MTAATPPRRAVAVLPLAMVALPVLSAGYQLAATMMARAGAGRPRAGAGLIAAASTPWFLVLLSCEIASFLLWNAVLARMPLSRAFPITALGYVLVVAVATVVLGEPIDGRAIAGSVVILAGAGLLATDTQ